MPNRQDQCIPTIVAVQNDIATISKVNQPLAKLRLHVFCRSADTWLFGDDIHSLANGPYRTFGGFNVLFSKATQDTDDEELT
jgi:hypothetical protein